MRIRAHLINVIFISTLRVSDPRLFSQTVLIQKGIVAIFFTKIKILKRKLNA